MERCLEFRRWKTTSISSAFSVDFISQSQVASSLSFLLLMFGLEESLIIYFLDQDLFPENLTQIENLYVLLVLSLFRLLICNGTNSCQLAFSTPHHVSHALIFIAFIAPHDFLEGRGRIISADSQLLPAEEERMKLRAHRSPPSQFYNGNNGSREWEVVVARTTIARQTERPTMTGRCRSFVALWYG